MAAAAIALMVYCYLAPRAAAQIESFHDSSPFPFVSAIELRAGRVCNFTSCTLDDSDYSWIQVKGTDGGAGATPYGVIETGCPEDTQILALGLDPQGNPLWFDGERKLKRLPHSASFGTEPEELATSPAGASTVSDSTIISAVADRIFWTTTDTSDVDPGNHRSTVHMLAAGASRITALIIDGAIVDLQAIGTERLLYLTSLNQLWQAHVEAGRWRTNRVIQISSPIVAFFASHDKLYTSVREPAQLKIRSLLIGDNPSGTFTDLTDLTTLHSESRSGDSSRRLDDLTADDHTVYWFRRPGGLATSGQVYRIHTATGSSAALVTGILDESPRDLASDGCHLYWARGNDLIERLPLIDSDLDDLPDGWERLHFGTLARSGGDDSDFDDQINSAELAAGTRPNDGGDRFDLSEVDVAANGDVTLNWPAREHRSYTVYRSTDLDGFTAIAEGLTTGTYLDSSAPPGRVFYFVEAHFCQESE